MTFSTNELTKMASSDNFISKSNPASRKKWSVFLFPYFAKGHIIPMTDFARHLSASHPDIEPTMVVTPGNTTFISSSLDYSNSSSQQPVQILTYPFPSIGLKPNLETVGIGTSEESSTIDQAFHKAHTGQEQLLQQYQPDAVIVDGKFPWVATIAANLGIPCLYFLTSGVFPILACEYLSRTRPKVNLQDHVTISGLPGPEIRMPVLELPHLILPEEENFAKYLQNVVVKSWLSAFGIIVNTFRELEQEYCDQFAKTLSKRAYFVGPVSHSGSTDQDGILDRGGKGDINCLRWLNEKEERSVIFVSFGSQCYFKSAQLHELALGLEESGQQFLWVVRGDDQHEWMPQGWEERIGNRGLVVKGWVPQVAILSHSATGAFVTHCGWNSILESTAAGVPMLTWPFAAEEFISEKLLVDNVGCASRLWEGGKRSTRETESELVPRAVIARAVARFMKPASECSTVHCKAREIGAVARRAMADGGSSKADLSRMISELINAMESKKWE